MEKKNEEFECWVDELYLWECKILEKVLLDLEGYEYLQIVQKQIDKRMDEMLNNMGFVE